MRATGNNRKSPLSAPPLGEYHRRDISFTHSNKFEALPQRGSREGASHYSRIKHSCRRHIDDTKNRTSLFHESNIDGELTILFDKLLRTIKRVNHPKPVPSLALFVRKMRPLFTQDRDSRWFKMADNAIVCSLISKRQRAIVCLSLNTEVLRGIIIEAHNLPPSLNRRIYRKVKHNYRL